MRMEGLRVFFIYGTVGCCELFPLTISYFLLLGPIQAIGEHCNKNMHLLEVPYMTVVHKKLLNGHIHS